MGARHGTSSLAWLKVLLLVLIGATPSLQAQAPRGDAKSDKAVKATDKAVKATDKAGKAAKPADNADELSTSPGDVPTTPRPGGLRMSRAVVCKSIDGYEIYKPLPGAAQTSEEKLLIYFRPLRYKSEFVDGFYRAHLVQDNEIRRRGRKEIVRYKKKVVEYDPKSKDPLGPIYIRNTISLKGLEPGDYELTIILRDELDKGAPPSRQVVKFKVIPPHDGARKARSQDEGPPPETSSEGGR